MFKSLFAAAALALTCGAAQAASVTFDYTGSALGAAPAAQSIGGITADVTGMKCFRAGCVTGSIAARVQAWSTGLGIQTDAHGRNSDSHQVDGAVGYDVLVFSFNRAVSVLAATFSYVDPNDRVTLFRVDGGGLAALETGIIGVDGAFSGRSGGRSSDRGGYAVGGAFAGDSFGLGTGRSSDNWKLTSLTVTALAPVPLPAAAWMLLAGLGGLLTLGRRGARRA